MNLRGLTRGDYGRHYSAGWRAAASGGSGLERPHHPAWEDGYFDFTAGLPKWHRRDCPQTHGHDGCDLA